MSSWDPDIRDDLMLVSPTQVRADYLTVNRARLADLLVYLRERAGLPDGSRMQADCAELLGLCGASHGDL